MAAAIHLSRLRIAEEILAAYKGSVPFHHHLKNYFRQHRNMGSRDRKELSRLCYAYFRLGQNVKKLDTPKALAWAAYLQAQQEDEALAAYRQEGLIHYDVFSPKEDERVNHLKHAWKEVNLEDLFPCSEKLSSGLNRGAFISNHLSQPALWFRCKLNMVNDWEQLLHKNHIPFTKAGISSYKLPQGTDLESLCGNSHAYGEIQDLSSSSSLMLLEEVKGKVWDCCAASGGKSLALIDRFPGIELYASDLRDTMLENLEERLKKARIPKAFTTQADLSTPKKKLSFMRDNEVRLVDHEYFDTIVLDAPCTGSGTWSRNPENLVYFDCESLKRYTALQRNILETVSAFLKPGGKLLYITCSAFAEENERQTEKTDSLSLLKQQYFTGYENGADTMFGALMEKAGT